MLFKMPSNLGINSNFDTSTYEQRKTEKRGLAHLLKSIGVDSYKDHEITISCPGLTGARHTLQ